MNRKVGFSAKVVRSMKKEKYRFQEKGDCMPYIETERLKLTTFTAELMEAFLKGNDEVEKIIPYRVVPGYPLEVYKRFFEYKIDRFRNYPSENEWEGMIIHKRDHMIMGDMGFKGGRNCGHWI